MGLSKEKAEQTEEVSRAVRNVGNKHVEDDCEGSQATSTMPRMPFIGGSWSIEVCEKLCEECDQYDRPGSAEIGP